MIKLILKKLKNKRSNLIKLETSAGKKEIYQLGGNYCNDMC